VLREQHRPRGNAALLETLDGSIGIGLLYPGICTDEPASYL